MMLSFKQFIIENNQSCPIFSAIHMKVFQKFVDRVFEKFGIDFTFTKHFRERLSDNRNNPCISAMELQDFIQNIYKRNSEGQKLFSKHADSEIVLKDMQSDLNMPIIIKYNRRDDSISVVAKTIMRKRDFKTPNVSVYV